MIKANQKEEVLTLLIRVQKEQKVEGNKGTAQMVFFEGTATGNWFTGNVLSGGIDTQIYTKDTSRMSARYILEGVDCEGECCRIFIENNAEMKTGGEITTSPYVITDSKALSWLEQTELEGKMEFCEQEIKLHIYRK